MNNWLNPVRNDLDIINYIDLKQKILKYIDIFHIYNIKKIRFENYLHRLESGTYDYNMLFTIKKYNDSNDSNDFGFELMRNIHDYFVNPYAYHINPNPNIINEDNIRVKEYLTTNIELHKDTIRNYFKKEINFYNDRIENLNIRYNNFSINNIKLDSFYNKPPIYKNKIIKYRNENKSYLADVIYRNNRRLNGMSDYLNSVNINKTINPNIDKKEFIDTLIWEYPNNQTFSEHIGIPRTIENELYYPTEDNYDSYFARIQKYVLKKQSDRMVDEVIEKVEKNKKLFPELPQILKKYNFSKRKSKRKSNRKSKCKSNRKSNRKSNTKHIIRRRKSM